MSLFLPAGLEQPAHEAHTVPDPPVHASPASYLHDSATLLPPASTGRALYRPTGPPSLPSPFATRTPGPHFAPVSSPPRFNIEAAWALSFPLPLPHGYFQNEVRWCRPLHPWLPSVHPWSSVRRRGWRIWSRAAVNPLLLVRPIATRSLAIWIVPHTLLFPHDP
jgi:hypothetical protein